MTTSTESRRESGLIRGLGTWQILCIAISGTIGIGFATHTGEVLAISGPGGVLLTFGVVGFVVINVMEGVCEMIVLWPISNAMIEFVRAFVDRDLAIVVGIAYWYSYATTLAALVIGAADLLLFWNISDPMLNVTFVLFLLTIFVINSRGIIVFGWIELFGGIIKVIALVAIFIVMICINYGVIGNGGYIGDVFFDDGVKNNSNVANSHLESVLMSIPLAIFSYIGVEVVTVTAFEASNPSRLQGPAKHIAYVVTAIYLITIGGFVANIEWFNQHLPAFFFQPLVSLDDPNLGHTPYTWPNYSGSSAAPVVAVLQAGIKVLPGVFTGFIVYSGLSSATTNLYVASRTLYGLTRDLSQTDSNRVVRFFAYLNTISPTTRIPVWSLIISGVVFACWLPFVKLHSGYSQIELQQTLAAVGSVGCVLVWASQCLAFIRYRKWLSKHRDMLHGQHLERFQRWPITGFSSYAASIQPVPAWIGLVSCLVVVFVLNSVSMYNHTQLLFKALTIYLGPGILLLIFIGLKIWNRRSFVKLGEWDQLHETLSTLDALIEGDMKQRSVPRTQSTEPMRNLLPITYPTFGTSQGYSQPSGAVYTNQGRTVSDPYDDGFILPPTAAEAAEAAQHRARGSPIIPQHQFRDNSPHSSGHLYRNQDMGGGYEMNSMQEYVPASLAVEMHSESAIESSVDGNLDNYRVSAMSNDLRTELPTPPMDRNGSGYMGIPEHHGGHTY